MYLVDKIGGLLFSDKRVFSLPEIPAIKKGCVYYEKTLNAKVKRYYPEVSPKEVRRNLKILKAMKKRKSKATNHER
jgi:hypothetical protein